jgi:CBS domain-containing protein
MTVAEILRSKGSRVITVQPGASLAEAVQVLVRNGVGLLVVADASGRMVGIISERDVLRESARNFDRLAGRKVADIMTSDVIIGLVEDTLDYVMALMSEKRIRHLPIMSHGDLVGIVSIGDVVKARGKEAEVEIRHLTDYITGKYPG